MIHDILAKRKGHRFEFKTTVVHVHVKNSAIM